MRPSVGAALVGGLPIVGLLGSISPLLQGGITVIMESVERR